MWREKIVYGKIVWCMTIRIHWLDIDLKVIFPLLQKCSFPLLLISKACRLQKKSNDAEKNWSQGNVDDGKIFVELAVVASRAHLPATEESLQAMRITYHPLYINSTQLTLTRVSN